MTSPPRSSASARPISGISSRLSQSSLPRTPTPNSPRRRNNSHLESSLFERPFTTTRMSQSASHLPVQRLNQPGHNKNRTYRDHNSTSFEWKIEELQSLKDYIEDECGSSDATGLDNLPDALKRGVVIGEGWYKLDIAKTVPVRQGHDSELNGMPDRGNKTSTSSLSLYIANLTIGEPQYAYSASIFVGIKSFRVNVGRRHAATQWHWSHETTCEFSAEAEYWDCELPLLSELLEVPDLKENDTLSLCVQISTPAAELPPFSLPSRLPVPHNIIDALDGLFDNKGGDVRFICLEHTISNDNLVGTNGDDVESSKEEGTRPLLHSRKRVLCAHSEILKARGEYFKDLLSGGFSESELIRRSSAPYQGIIVDDAQFETVYWMLRFIYTNHLLFAEVEDVRALMHQQQLNQNEVSKMLNGAIPTYAGAAEWEYRRLPYDGEDVDDDFDTRTIRSVSSTGTRQSGLSPPTSVNGRKSMSGAGRGVVLKSSNNGTIESTRSIRPPRPVTSQSQIPSRARGNDKSSTTTHSITNLTPTTTPKPSSTGSPISKIPSPQSITTRHYASRHSDPDPHSHPCTPPPPASALSIYMLAHRYRLEALQSLAKDHLLDHLTPANCTSYLLASHQYESLHNDILDYTMDNWAEVQVDTEFLRCIQEISAGTWGPSGGLVLHGLFKRL